MEAAEVKARDVLASNWWLVAAYLTMVRIKKTQARPALDLVAA